MGERSAVPGAAAHPHQGARRGCFAKLTPSAGNAPPTSPNQVRTEKLRRSHWEHDSSRRSNATAREIKRGSGRTGRTEPRQRGRAGMLGAGLRAGVRQDPKSWGRVMLSPWQPSSKCSSRLVSAWAAPHQPAEASLGRAAMLSCLPGWQEGVFQVLLSTGPSAQRKRGHPGSPCHQLPRYLRGGGDKAQFQILCF